MKKNATFLISLFMLASCWSTTSAFQPGSVKTTTAIGVATRPTTSNVAKSSCALFSKTARKSKAIPALSATKLDKETELQQPIASNHDDVATSWRKQRLDALRRWMTRLVETLLVAAQQRWRQVVLAINNDNNNNNNKKKDRSVTATDASPVKHSFQQLARQTQSHCVALVRRHVVTTDMAAKSIRASRQRLQNVLQQEQPQGTTTTTTTTATTAIKPLLGQSTTPTTTRTTTTKTTATTLVNGISNEPKHVKARHEQPKSPAQEAQLQAKYAAIASLEERAFCILLDLGMVQDTTSSWPS